MIPAIGIMKPAIKLSTTKEWSLANASFVAQANLNSTYSGRCAGIHVNPSGTVLTVISPYRDRIAVYDFSTPWDITTLSFSYQNYNIYSYESAAYGVTWNDDNGKYLFWIGYASDKVWRRFCTYPYQLSSGGSPSAYLDVDPYTSVPISLCFGNNGYKLYILDNHASVVEFTLSVAYRPDYATYQRTQGLPYNDGSYGIAISPSGLKLAITTNADKVYLYPLSIPWDISTIGTPEILDISSYGYASGISINPDGNKMYLSLSTSSGTILEWNL
jgi:DNA-binding beta-propeller fold protein YncE